MKISSTVLLLVLAAFGAALTPKHVTKEGQLNRTSYAPTSIQCPIRKQWVRPPVGLSEEETLWVEGRRREVLKGLESYLGRLHLQEFDIDEYLERISCDDNIPRIDIAISGGAWSSALTGTGALRAFDERFQPSREQRTGGILQCATYISGLSGGSWPVMGLTTYNFPEIDYMVSQWRVDVSPFNAPNNTPHRGTNEVIFGHMYEKAKAGYNVSFGDYLGLASAYEFAAGSDGAVGTMLSDIEHLSNFKNHGMPMPFWQAAQATYKDIAPLGIEEPYPNSTIFEFSPFEFGAWGDPSGFFPTKYLGTKMVDGKPVSEDNCIVGFDRVPFMLGLPTDAWNVWWLSALSNGTLGQFQRRSSLTPRANTGGDTFPVTFLEELEKEFKKLFNLTRIEAMYASLPNPFATTASVSDNVTTPENITLVDGSEARQDLPLWPLIQPARGADLIVAWDSGQEVLPYTWNDGDNLHQTYTEATNHSIPFPIVPPASTFINRNYTWKPTFFGCDANLTNTKDLQAPIVLYIPNSPYSTFTNYSAFYSNFTNEEMATIMTNSFNVITQGNGTLSSGFAECIGCAAIDRSLARMDMPRTKQCELCMAEHCWDGVEDNSPTGVLDLSLALDPSLSYYQWNKSYPQDGLYWEEVEKKK